MAPSMLEAEDHARDAAFNKALHGKSAGERGGFMAMMKKDAVAQKAAVDEYFKHWDNKHASVETQEVRDVRDVPQVPMRPHTYNRPGTQSRVCDIDSTVSLIESIPSILHRDIPDASRDGTCSFMPSSQQRYSSPF